MVLYGIWQGIESPPRLQYMNAFGDEMCSLYEDNQIVKKSKVCFEPSGPYRPELIPVSVTLSD